MCTLVIIDQIHSELRYPLVHWITNISSKFLCATNFSSGLALLVVFAYTTSAAETNYLVPCFIHNPFQNCPRDNITPTATQLPLCLSGLWGITRFVFSPD